MYTPIMWSNPNNLELIKEKREIERSENLHVKKIINEKKSTKAKLIDALNKTFALRSKLNFEV